MCHYDARRKRPRERPTRECGTREVFLLICCLAVLSSSSLTSAFIPGTRRRHSNPHQIKRPESRYTRTYSDASPSFIVQRELPPITALGVGSISRSSSSSTDQQKINNNKQQYSNINNRNGKASTSKDTIRRLFRRAKDLERKGQWRQSATVLHDILQLDPADSHSHLALARLEARRAPHEPQRAIEAFQNGTSLCPNSIHLWHAYAHFQQNQNQVDKARELYERALQIDPSNPYVCHAYGLMEQKHNNASYAINLWERALSKTSTAALVCSLGEALIARQEYTQARELYMSHVHKIKEPREKMEIYLAASWLEERYFQDDIRAEELLHLAIESSPTSSVAQVALARFEGRKRKPGTEESQQATLKRLASTCIGGANSSKQSMDGRVYNAWAHVEVKRKRFKAAREILQKGLTQYPFDHTLLQAAGKVEERMGNYSGARSLYASSLQVEPSAPTLVAYALLDIRYPESGDGNLTRAIGLFEEALLVDPRHGPAYNAYARTVFRKMGDADKAREIYQRGVAANCPDAASIYHGYAMLELWLGNVDRARLLLIKGIEKVKRQDASKDYVHRERALFLSHTLGMVELNRNHPSDALKVFTEGIERYGNSSQLLLGAALSEVMLGNQDNARSLFEMSVLNDASHAHAWQAWGVMEMRAGDIKTAKKLFESGIKNASRHGALWQAYATMESRLGNLEAARALFETGVKKDPRHIPLYQSWAFMELREGNYVAAKSLIGQALTRDKTNGAGWLISSKIEDQMGNDGLAGLLLRRGIECAPDMGELYCALGESLVRKGKINDARGIFEKGIEVDPTYAPLYHSLAELEAQVFNLDGLARLNRRAKTIFNSNALVPPATSSEMFGAKIRARNVPTSVTALTERIVEDKRDATETTSGSYLNKRLSSNLLEKGGRVGRLLSFEDHEDLSTGHANDKYRNNK